MHPRLPIFQAFEQGKTVITPNNRLSAELLRDFYRYKNTEFNHAFIEKPRCFPFQTWLHKFFSSVAAAYPHQYYPLLLSPEQSHFLWAEILSQEQDATSLFSGLIEEVREAWKRCNRWEIDFSHPTFAKTPQTNQFQIWANAFQQKLQELNALDEELLIHFFIQNGFEHKEKQFIWYCFEELTPIQKKWQSYLESQGCTVETLDIEPNTQIYSNNNFLYAAADEEDEYQQLVLHIKNRLALGDKRIGIIVPDLESKALPLQRLLQESFTKSEFNISLGKPLTHFPLIAHAFAFLKLNTENLGKAEIHLLLYSPFLSFSDQEKLARMQSLQDYKAMFEENMNMEFFVQLLEANTPALAALLRDLETFPESASVTDWIDLFAHRLRVFGFPGEYPLNSENYQCYMRFLSLFEEFKTLNLLSDKLSKSKALQTFEGIAQRSIFQAETKTAGIQILGLLEATGCIFDSLWISNMSNECLPKKTKLSPFIPAQMQKDNAMPHACPLREIELAQKMIERLKRCSGHSVFSYPCITQDKPNLASPLLLSLPLYCALPVLAKPSMVALEPYQESYQLALHAETMKTGNTALLANQAKCPFKAFATHRLHAKKPMEASDGLHAIERGKILHRVMELLWKKLKNQKSLLSMPVDILETLIHQCIAFALKPYQEATRSSFPALVQAIETKRIFNLIKAHLEWEKTRPPFEIQALEEAFSLEIAGIEFHLRIDRLDSTSSGKKWVIDYKSSLAQQMPWKEERPKEPQLLLYALLDADINTMLFAGLKEGKLSIKGLSEDQTQYKEIQSLKEDENWEILRQTWEQQIHALAEEYSEGFCAPKPLDAGVCQQCDFQSLCRWKIA